MFRRKRDRSVPNTEHLIDYLKPEDKDRLANLGWQVPCDCHPFKGNESDCFQCHWPESYHRGQVEHRCWNDQWRQAVETQGGYYVPTSRGCPTCDIIGPHIHVVDVANGMSNNVMLSPEDIDARRQAIAARRAAQSPPPLHLGYGGGD